MAQHSTGPAAPPAGDRRRRGLRFALPYLAAVPITGHAAAFFAGWTSRDIDAVWLTVDFSVVNAILLGFGLRAAWHPALDAAGRRAWRLVMAGLVAYTVGGYVYGMAAVQGIERTYQPVLLFWTAARALAVVGLLGGLFSFAAAPLGRRGRLKLGLDVVTVLGCGLMLVWYLVVGRALFGAGPPGATAGALTRLVVVAWPACDLVLLVGAATVVMRGTLATARRPVRLLLAATGCHFASDVTQVFLVMERPDEPVPNAWAFAALLVSGLYAAAAVEQCRVAGDPRPVARQGRGLPPNHYVPYLALVLGFGLLGLAAARTSPYPWAGLVLGSVVMTSAVAARQLLALRENQDLVMTDTLTGLANRRPLWTALDQAMRRGRRSGRPVALIVVDLDGFKEINDSYGHDAGDGVLVAFAGILTRHARAVDLAVRLGGDEFALLLEGASEHGAVTVAERIQAEAARPTVVRARAPVILPIRCSIGIAVADPAAGTGPAEPDELLHRADHAMYRAKRAGDHRWCLDHGTAARA